MSSLPPYRELPVDRSKPPTSAWGVFGCDDQVGTISLRGAERLGGHRVAAAMWDTTTLEMMTEQFKLGGFFRFHLVSMAGMAIGELFGGRRLCVRRRLRRLVHYRSARQVGGKRFAGKCVCDRVAQ